MTTSRLRAAVALVLAAFAAACGGDGGSGGPTFPDSVSTADAEEAADGSAQAATYLAENLNFGSPSIGFAAAMTTRLLDRSEVVAAQGRMRWVRPIEPSRLDWRARATPAGMQASSAAGCTVTIRGSWDAYGEDPVDENENGIPDDYLYEVDCESTEEYGGDTVVTFWERYRVSYQEIDDALHGVNASIVYSEGGEDNYGNFEKVEVDQSGNIDIRSGSASTGQAVEFTLSARWDGESEVEGWGESWDASFDPDGTITLGDDLPDGDLTLNGRTFFHATGEPGASFEISTPTALAYDAACAAVPTDPPFTAGVLRGELNGSSSQASFEVTFTACGSYTVDVDGAYDEPMVAVR